MVKAALIGKRNPKDTMHSLMAHHPLHGVGGEHDPTTIQTACPHVIVPAFVVGQTFGDT